jgi:hypothetical protein
MFRVIGGQETLAHLGIGNVIAGLDDVRRILAEDLQIALLVPVLTAAASAAAASSGEG